MSFNEVVYMMKFNLKDVMIMLELLLIAVMYFFGLMSTTRQPKRIKATIAKILTGTMFAEFALILLYVAFAIQL